MKRKFILTFIILFLVLANINSASYESLEDLKMVSTEHFDIIYNDESSASASLLEEKCESIYNEIITSFALNRTQRFYVVVTTQRQMFNSYFTAYQTPRIVMFDTIADSNSFNSNKYNNFLNVFRHELTHALTLTTENGFFQKYVSQLISFYNISTTRFAKEGIAVLSESLSGSGRLNDPLYKSILIQSKIDGNFPSYYDVQDAQVGFKNDNYYLYGGFFFKYLVDTYGLEKFQEYWDELGKIDLLVLYPTVKFQEVYGHSIDEVWANFELSIENADLKQVDEIKQYESYNPTYMTKEDNYLYFLDYNTSSIKRMDIETDRVKNVSENKMYCNTFSVENGTVLSSSISQFGLTNTYLQRTTGFKTTTLELDNTRGAVSSDGQIVALRNNGQIESIVTFNKSYDIINQYYLAEEEKLQDLLIHDDEIIFTSRYNSVNSVSILKDGSREIYKIGSDISINGLSMYKDDIVLSTCRDGELLRCTIIDPENHLIKTNNFDVDGGMYYPNIINDDVYYISERIDENILSSIPLNKMDFKVNKIESVFLTENYNPTLKYELDGAKDYKPALELLKNTKALFFFLPGFSEYFDSNFFLTTYAIDPTETYSYVSTLDLVFDDSFYPEEQQYSLTLTKDTGLKMNSFGLSITNEGDEYDIFQSNHMELSTGVSKIFDLKEGNFIQFYYSLQFGFANYSAYSNLSNISSQNYSSAILQVSSFNYIYYVNSGLNLNSYLRYSSGVSLENLFNFDNDDVNNNEFTHILTASLSLHLPYLIPNRDNRNYSYNLPTDLFIESSYNFYDNEMKFDAGTSITVYSVLINRGFELIPAYFKLFNIDAGYHATYTQEIGNDFSNNIDQYINLAAYFKMRPSTSALSDLDTELGIKFEWEIEGGLNLTYGFQSNF